MRILLVSPEPLNYVPFTPAAFPTGMASISAFLKNAGYNVSCVNGALCKGCASYDEVFLELQKGGIFDIIGIGGLSCHYPAVDNLVQLCRQCFPEAKIVIGGNLVSTMPALVLKELRADFGVLGEGELPMLDLARNLESSGTGHGIPAVAVRDNETNEVTLPEKNMNIIKDLDSLPMPDYEGFGFSELMKMAIPSNDSYSLCRDCRRADINASRSCLGNCTFCYHPAAQFRQRSLDSCFREIDYLVEHLNYTKTRYEGG